MCESVSSASVCSSSGPFMTPKPVCPSCILISHHSFQCHPEYSASFFTATSISAFCWNYFLSPPAVFHKAPAHAIFRLLSCPFSDHSSYFPLFSPQYFSFIWVIVFHWFLIFFFCAPLLFVFCFLFHFSFTSVSWTTLTANDRRPHSVKWRAFNNWGSASLAMKLGQRWRQRVMTYVLWIFLFLTLFFLFFPSKFVLQTCHWIMQVLYSWMTLQKWSVLLSIFPRFLLCTFSLLFPSQTFFCSFLFIFNIEQLKCHLFSGPFFTPFSTRALYLIYNKAPSPFPARE